MAQVNNVKNASIKAEVANLNSQIALMKSASGKLHSQININQANKANPLSPVAIENRRAETKVSDTAGFLAALRNKVASLFTLLSPYKTEEQKKDEDRDTEFLSPVEISLDGETKVKTPGRFSSSNV